MPIWRAISALSDCAGSCVQPKATTGVSAGVESEVLEDRSATAGSSSRSMKREEEPVASEEIADPERVLRVARADDPQARELARLAEQLAARDQRREDHVPDVRRATLRSSRRFVCENAPGLGVARATAGGDRPRAGQPADLAGELAAVVHDDRLRLVPDSSRISIAPDMTMKKGRRRRRYWKSLSPVPERRRPSSGHSAISARSCLGERRETRRRRARPGSRPCSDSMARRGRRGPCRAGAVGPARGGRGGRGAWRPGSRPPRRAARATSSARSRSRSAGRDQKSRSEARTSVGARTSEASQSERPVAR